MGIVTFYGKRQREIEEMKGYLKDAKDQLQTAQEIYDNVATPQLVTEESFSSEAFKKDNLLYAKERVA